MHNKLTHSVTVGRLDFGGRSLAIEVLPGLMIMDGEHLDSLVDYVEGKIQISPAAPDPAEALCRAVRTVVTDRLADYSAAPAPLTVKRLGGRLECPFCWKTYKTDSPWFRGHLHREHGIEFPQTDLRIVDPTQEATR